MRSIRKPDVALSIYITLNDLMDGENIVYQCGSTGWVMLNAWKLEERQEQFYMPRLEEQGKKEVRGRHSWTVSGRTTQVGNWKLKVKDRNEWSRTERETKVL